MSYDSGVTEAWADPTGSSEGRIASQMSIIEINGPGMCSPALTRHWMQATRGEGAKQLPLGKNSSHRGTQLGALSNLHSL